MEGKKIVCLGDSLTFGYPYGSKFSWVYYVACRSSLEMINAGFSGNILEDMAKRYRKDVKRRSPDLLVVLGGTNDAYNPEVSCAESIFHLEKIINEALSDQIRPVIALPMPVIDDFAVGKLERIRAEERDLANRFNLSWFDFADAFTDPSGSIKEDLYLDGVHPNTTGYEAMGAVALAFFQEFFQR